MQHVRKRCHNSNSLELIKIFAEEDTKLVWKVPEPFPQHMKQLPAVRVTENAENATQVQPRKWISGQKENQVAVIPKK